MNGDVIALAVDLIQALAVFDGSGKVPTTAPYNFVNQLNTAGRFMWNKATKVRRTVDAASQI